MKFLTQNELHFSYPSKQIATTDIAVADEFILLFGIQFM